MNKTLIALLIFISSSVFAGQPLYSSAQSPNHSNILSLQLRDAKPQPVGSLEVKTGFTQASVWAETNEYFLDYYQNNLDLALSYQVTNLIKSELAFKRIKARDNGLDELTMNFHDLFGIGQNGRDEVPQDQFYIGIPGQGVEISDFEGETLTRAIQSYNELSLYQNPIFAVSAGLTLYYNHVDSGPFARTTFEQGLQLNTSYSIHSHHVYTSFGGVHRNGDILGTEMVDSAGFISLGYEYQFFSAHSVLVESHNYKGWASTNPDFSEPSNELLLGYRYRFLNTAIEAFMTENVRNMDSSTDIAFTIVLRTLL